MSGITLHKEKGVNPRMTVCRQCGKDVGIILLGAREYKDICKSCGTTHIGGSDNGICNKCGSRDFKREPIEEYEKIPVEFCDDCKKIQEQAAELVKQGGVYWRCAKCGSQGALSAENPLSAEVREKMGIPAPKPCGVEFEECPVCNPEENENAND